MMQEIKRLQRAGFAIVENEEGRTVLRKPFEWLDSKDFVYEVRFSGKASNPEAAVFALFPKGFLGEEYDGQETEQMLFEGHFSIVTRKIFSDMRKRAKAVKEAKELMEA